jgi:hypothetical protein
MPAAAKPEKPTRDQKKAARAARRAKRRQTWSQLREVFKATRKADKRFLPYLIGGFVIVAAVVYVVGMLFLGPILPIVPAIALGLMAAMLIFSRRAQRTLLGQAEGQPGAALSVLQNVRGDWKLTEAVAATAQFDAVHRLTGRPGIVLVGEGATHRVKGLLAQEKRRLSRLVGDIPIYDIIVGAEDGQIPLRKLNAHLIRLPRNLTREQVSGLNRKLTAMTATRPPIPRGPMPANAKLRNPARTVRRRT